VLDVEYFLNYRSYFLITRTPPNKVINFVPMSSAFLLRRKLEKSVVTSPMIFDIGL